MTRWHCTCERVLRVLGPLVLLAVLVSGCASERAPINRVQSNAMAKAFFVGQLGDARDDPEFYFRSFVVDGSEAQSLIGIGSWSGVDRVLWEITETTLYARKAYGTGEGADDKGKNGGGVVVAAYPIEKHFDIQRDYNPSTGEELNIIVENTTDRIWSEREYFRVDWSKNLVDTPQWFDMFLGRLFGDVKVTPLAYYVNDASHPDAPHFAPEEGYFDVTSKFFVEPEPIESPFSDLSGKVPGCLLTGLYTGTAVDNCDPQEAVVRSSYLRVDRVDPDDDFEPFENTVASLDIVGNPGGLGDSLSVGIVTPPRVQWDPQYGYTDAGMKKFMHVHEIWQQSHQTRPPAGGGVCAADSDCPGAGARCLRSGRCSVPCDYDARGDTGPKGEPNGTDDQCENEATDYAGSEGSQCSAKNRCTLPYRDRELKPILFFMNKETPEALTDTLDDDGKVVERGPTEDIVYSWNQLLRIAVAKAREIECRATGGSRKSCHDEYFDEGTEMLSFGGWGLERVREMPDVLSVCHNPVRDYDLVACGEPGSSARVGDLRKNFLVYWPYASRAPWGGIGNWNADPLTGRILGAAATTMGRSATYSAALTRDIIMVANGELDIDDITEGTPARLYQKELTDGRKPRALDQSEVARRRASIDPTHAMEAVGPKPLAGNVAEQFAAVVKLKQKSQATIGAASSSHLKYQALVKKLRDTTIEADLVNPSWLVDTLGQSPDHVVDDAALALISPLRGHDPDQKDGRDQLLNLRLEARGVCFVGADGASVGNPDIAGVARFYKQKYSDANLIEMFPDELDEKASASKLSKRRAELIYEDLWKLAYKGIQLHELGHALGLLHQFASSYDSTNFNPQYWQLRTQEGRALDSCQGNPRSGDTFDSARDTCMGPRYLDPETDDELGQASESRPGLSFFGHTSTMEYQNERFFESVGLGQYDLFAMAALYGRVLQTFDPDAKDGLSERQQLAFAARHISQLADEHLVHWESELGDFVQPMHYTEAARRMKLYDRGRCRDATKEEIARAEWRLVHDKVCTPPPKDYARWQDFVDGQLVTPSGGKSPYDAPKWKVKDDARAGGSNVRWPYRWGVSVNAYPHTNPSDAGADIYEVTRETIKKFDYSYPFTYFRRERRDWVYRDVPAITASRFYERLRAFHWSIAVNTARYRSFGEEIFDQIAGSDDWFRPFVMAQSEMFGAIARSLLMPQIGQFGVTSMPGSVRRLYDVVDGGNSVIEFELDASSARYVDPDFDSGPQGGGSWSYQEWVKWTGFSSEKSHAAKALTDGRAVFFTISRENYLDGRNVNINFRSDMPSAVDRLIGGVLAADWETVAPYVNAGEAYPAVEMLDLAGAEPGTYPDGARVLFPNLGYQQQLGTLVWAYLFSRLNTDLTLANKLRIWIEGQIGEVDIPEDQQIRFYNPESAFVYIARRYGTELNNGKTVEKGIASRMLARANDLLAIAYEVERDANGPILDAFGLPTLVLDESGAPIRTEDRLGTKIKDFRDYVGLLDAAVQVGTLIGHGPLGPNERVPE